MFETVCTARRHCLHLAQSVAICGGEPLPSRTPSSAYASVHDAVVHMACALQQCLPPKPRWPTLTMQAAELCFKVLQVPPVSHERKALERTFKGVLQTVRCARYPPVQQHYTYRGMMRLNRSVYQNCRGRATTRAPLRSRTGFAPCNHSSGTWQCLPACLHKLIKTSARPLPLPRTILHEFASTPQRS